MEDPYNKQL